MMKDERLRQRHANLQISFSLRRRQSVYQMSSWGWKSNQKSVEAFFGGLHACTYKKENKARVCAWKLFSLEGQISSWAKSPRNTFSRPFFGVLLCLVARKRRRMDARYSSGDWCRGHYCVQQPTTHLLTTKYPKKKWLIPSN